MTEEAWTPDFAGTSAFTPIYPKGDYELTVKDIRAAAWRKEQDGGGTIVVKRVRVVPTVNGVYNSEGELSDELDDGTEVAGEDCSNLDLWLHSEGGVKQAKRHLMAILGYSKDEEDEFNEWATENDLSFNVVENDDGSLSARLGDAWETLKGRLFIAAMEPQTETFNDEEREVQNFRFTQPAGSIS